MVKKKFKFHWMILISGLKQKSGARLLTSTVPLLETENDFIFIRSYLLHISTVIEQQTATRITKAADSIRPDPINDPLNQISLKPKSKWIENLIIHYAHEARLTAYK